MTTRTHSRRTGRPVGRADAGDGNAAAAALLAFALLYFGIHALFWLGRTVMP